MNFVTLCTLPIGLWISNVVEVEVLRNILAILCLMAGCSRFFSMENNDDLETEKQEKSLNEKENFDKSDVNVDLKTVIKIENSEINESEGRGQSVNEEEVTENHVNTKTKNLSLCNPERSSESSSHHSQNKFTLQTPTTLNYTNSQPILHDVSMTSSEGLRNRSLTSGSSCEPSFQEDNDVIQNEESFAQQETNTNSVQNENDQTHPETIKIDKIILNKLFYTCLFTHFLCGICSGMLALAGPPFVFFVMFKNLNKRLTRMLGASYGIFECPVRTIYLIFFNEAKENDYEIDYEIDFDPTSLNSDFPFFVLIIFVSLIGLIVGDRSAKYISQKTFSQIINFLIFVMGFAILGLFEFKLVGVISFFVVGFLWFLGSWRRWYWSNGVGRDVKKGERGITGGK